jgi:aminoglycoside/choline kinase family phosphotransferase
MIPQNLSKQLTELYSDWAGMEPVTIEFLSAHGSERKYFRIHGNKASVIGVYNADRAENRAFIELSNHFYKLGLPVPHLYHYSMDQPVYLIQDLGDKTLFSHLLEQREHNGFSDELVQLYERAVTLLIRFQIEGGKEIDYSICYPRSAFDKQSMLWDLSYFKYYFMKLAKISFNEQKLENDFHHFADFLLQASCNYFLYRDYQSRNIMILEGNLYCIDYQGGRKGALQYDIASLLYDAKADIPQTIRAYLLQKYLSIAAEYGMPDSSLFLKYYPGYILIRIMQALGAYGFRGFYERKPRFLESVPYAIKNLETVLKESTIPVEIPELRHVWAQIIETTSLRQIAPVTSRLTVSITSFAYKNGLPGDPGEHGGGFVFDCRALPNPGRYPEYAAYTGKDNQVIEFLKSKTEVKQFLRNIFRIVTQVIENYQERHFTSLTITFGCTGGRHRSVYCASRLAAYIKKKYHVAIMLQHRELEQG